MGIYHLMTKILSLVNWLFTTSQRKYLTENTCLNARHSHPNENTIASILPCIFGLVTKGPTPPPTPPTTHPARHLSTQSSTCSNTHMLSSLKRYAAHAFAILREADKPISHIFYFVGQFTFKGTRWQQQK